MRMKFPQAFIFIFQLSSTSVLPPFVPHFVLNENNYYFQFNKIIEILNQVCISPEYDVELQRAVRVVLALFFFLIWTVNCKDELWDVTTEASV